MQSTVRKMAAQSGAWLLCKSTPRTDGERRVCVDVVLAPRAAQAQHKLVQLGGGGVEAGHDGAGDHGALRRAASGRERARQQLQGKVAGTAVTWQATTWEHLCWHALLRPSPARRCTFATRFYGRESCLKMYLSHGLQSRAERAQ